MLRLQRALIVLVLGLVCAAGRSAVQALPQEPVAPPAADDVRRVPRPLVEGSLFTSRLFLGEERPELRSVRHIQLLYAGALGAPRELRRTQDEALELAASLRRALLEGADFDALARAHSASQNAPIGSVMGSFPAGVLQADFDAFLFAAEVGEVSAPILAPTGVHVLQRVERQAGCLELRITTPGPEGEQRIRALAAEIDRGADFQDLVRAHSQDPVTAARDGALAVFERGPSDRLLKGAVFRLAVGEVSDPIQSPLGWHLVKRVPVDEIPADLVEDNWMRFRGLAVLYANNPLGVPAPDRTPEAAADLGREIEARLRAGEDFVELVRLHDDDPSGGRARDGLFGWVHRRQPGLPPFMAEAFVLEVGEWMGPKPTNIGWVFVRREA